MKTVSQEKTHYKMYKAGKYWLFSLITVSSFVLGMQLRPLHTMVVQADDAGQSSSSVAVASSSSSSSSDSSSSSSSATDSTGSATAADSSSQNDGQIADV